MMMEALLRRGLWLVACLSQARRRKQQSSMEAGAGEGGSVSLRDASGALAGRTAQTTVVGTQKDAHDPFGDLAMDAAPSSGAR